MGFAIAIIGLLQIAAGALVFMSSKSAIHEILATAGFGFGMITLALGIGLTHLASIRDALEKRG